MTDTPTPRIDLNAWHRQLHAVTGSMALNFNRATLADLRLWAAELVEGVADTK